MRRSTRPGVVVLVLSLVLLLGCAGEGQDSDDGGPASTSGEETSEAAPAPGASSETPTESDTPGPEETEATPTDGAGPGSDSAPLDDVHIALDPGHAGGIGLDPALASTHVPDGRGGTKPCQAVGAATNSGYMEHEFTWDVVSRLTELLEADGAEVSLTRDNDADFGPCVDERGQFPQNVGADAYVSVHANGTEDPSVRGFFAILSDPPLHQAQGEPSVELAEHLLNELAGHGFAESNLVPGGYSFRADIAGLNHSEVPSVLMELGEMRHPEEAAVMQTPEGRQQYAEALYRGLLGWAEAQSAGEAEQPSS